MADRDDPLDPRDGPDVWDEVQPDDRLQRAVELLNDVVEQTAYVGEPKWPRLYREIAEFLEEVS